MIMSVRLTTKQFIERARAQHGDRYDYSKTIYTKAHDKVTIICRNLDHGEFQQIAADHTNGHGCPKFGCGNTGKLTTDED